jgi:uncharacterized membrane protein
MKRNYWPLAMTAIVLIGFIIGAALYGQMPDPMASHWNAAGVADGTVSRFWGVFLIPVISLGVMLLFLVIPLIDPLRANIQKFKGYYYGFATIFLVYFLYIYILTMLWNMDMRFDMTKALMPAIGILFIVVGVMIRKSKRNYMVGIRTPWTLSSDEVWERTHKLGGWLFIGAGIVTGILAIFLTSAIFWVMIGLILAVTAFTMVYSYVIYKQLEKAGKLPTNPTLLNKN